jgi:Arc/MetJ-type ribon-helix-helix transcriptional regulator
MAQMNVSITEALASYVRERVRSGRFSNASEVVREALTSPPGEADAAGEAGDYEGR